MKHLLYGGLLLAALCLWACRDGNLGLGKSLVESSFYNVYVDTCTVDISTVKLDSIETGGDSVCQLGHYSDDVWGEVYSSYYAEYSVTNFTPSADNAYLLDSLVLRLIPSGHFWGDTLQEQRISIYQLRYPIVLDNDEELYNTTSQLLEETPLTTFTYLPRPGAKREVEVRLPDALGREFLEDIVAQDDRFNSRTISRNTFPDWLSRPRPTVAVLPASW